MITLSKSTVELMPNLAANDAIGKSNDTAILWARLQSLLRRRSIQQANRRFVAQVNEEIENVRARTALAAEAGAAVSEQLLRVNQPSRDSNPVYRQISGNGQVTRDITITGPNGKQATVDTTGTSGNDQFTKDNTGTGPNGKQGP